MKSTRVKLLAVMMLFGFVAGCITTGSKDERVETGVGQQQVLFAEFKENRPSTEKVIIGNREADIMFASIQSSYTTTLDLTDKYIERVENSPVALVLEQVRQEHGDEAYHEAVRNLSPEDKKMYDEYLNNEINTLGVVIRYLADAVKLSYSVSRLDYKSLVGNPFQVPKAVRAGKLGVEQINFTVKALQILKQYRDTYIEAQTYLGR